GWPVAGSTPTWPETKTSAPVSSAGESGIAPADRAPCAADGRVMALRMCSSLNGRADRLPVRAPRRIPMARGLGDGCSSSRSNGRGACALLSRGWLHHERATVDLDDFAGDEGRERRGEEQDHVGDVARRAGAAERDAGLLRREPGVAALAAQGRGVDQAGRDAVDAHPGPAEL